MGVDAGQVSEGKGGGLAPPQGGTKLSTEALMNAGGNYNRPKVAKFLVG